MSAPPLVVVTRPQGRADNAVQQCRKAGWAVRHVPLLALVANQDFTDDINVLLQAADAVFFVSPSAVDFVAAKIDWRSFRGDILAVGAATAAVLRDIVGREVLYPQDGNDSEALLRLPLWQKRQGRLLIVRGVGGRELTAQTLRAAGWTVQCAEVYRRIPQYLSEIAQAQIFAHQGALAVIITSVESAQTWLASIAPQYSTQSKRLLYCTIHPRIGHVLRDAGMENVEDFLTENEIIEALHRRWDRI